MFQKSWTMARTEIRMVFKNRQVKSIPIILILTSAIFSIFFGWFVVTLPLYDTFIYQLMVVSTISTIVIAMPVMLPVMIAADSIVGEKERRTLLPLLATPLTDTELLFGKLLTALVPGLLVSYANLLLSTALINLMLLFLAPSLIWIFPVATPIALVQALVLPPLFSSLAVTIMITISERVTKVYEAYQLGGIIMIPVLIFAFTPILTGTGLDWPILLIGILGFLIANYFLFRLALRVFNRDQLITRT